MHLQFLGHPIANDQSYGGQILNEGEYYIEEDFANSYANLEEGGKRTFIKVWLHSFKYVFGDIKVKTEVPYWAKEEFLVAPKGQGGFLSNP